MYVLNKSTFASARSEQEQNSVHIKKCKLAGQISYSYQTNGKVKKVTKYLNQITECNPGNEVDPEENGEILIEDGSFVDENLCQK